MPKQKEQFPKKPPRESSFSAHLIIQYGCVRKKPQDLNLYASAHVSLPAAETAFEKQFGITYDEFLRLFKIVQDAPLGKRLPLTDEDRAVVKEHASMFWDDPSLAGRVPATQMVSITPLTPRTKMIVGGGAL